MTEIQQKMLNFLNETVEYYSVNPKERRCIEDDLGNCYYAPIHDETQGCAIGRHLPLNVSEQLDKYSLRITTIAARYPEIYNTEIKPRLDFQLSFLQDIQILHDNSYYWKTDGLSPKGRDMVEKIIKKIETNYYDE